MEELEKNKKNSVYWKIIIHCFSYQNNGLRNLGLKQGDQIRVARQGSFILANLSTKISNKDFTSRRCNN